MINNCRGLYMAIDTTAKTYENRTLQFYGAAYGDSNVSLTAIINGTTVFSGEVATINTPMPLSPVIFPSPTLLFSIENSTLFSTNWAGSYPMSIIVDGGLGVVFGEIKCNYMAKQNVTTISVMENSSITGNILTVGTVSSGTVAVGQVLNGTGIAANTQIVSGSDTTWTVNNSQTVPNTTITGNFVVSDVGVADEYRQCYNGSPVNSENTIDTRSNVKIDGVTQVPLLPHSEGLWTWDISTGSTFEYNLNVSFGNCAQS